MSLSMMKRACFCLLLGQGEVALGVLVDLLMYITFGSAGLMYVTDGGNSRVCVWSKEGSLQSNSKTKSAPTCIAATGDNRLIC